MGNGGSEASSKRKRIVVVWYSMNMKKEKAVLPDYGAAYDYVYNYLNLTPVSCIAKKVDGWPILEFTCKCGHVVDVWEENGEVYGEY